MPDPVYVYVFTGTHEEDFADFGRLAPGDQVKTMEQVYHARLKLVDGPAAQGAKVDPGKSEAKPSAPQTPPA